MALVRDEYWIKLAGRERSREKRESREIMEGKKLITRKRECSERVQGVELMTVVEWCMSGAKGLRLIGREFHRRERSCGMIDLQT